MHAVTYQAAMMLQPSTFDTPHTIYLAQVAAIKLLKEHLGVHASNCVCSI